MPAPPTPNHSPPTQPPRATSTFPRSASALILATTTALLLAACEREGRTYRVEPPYAATIESKRLTDQVPGGGDGGTSAPLHHQNSVVNVENPYENNAYAIAQGKMLFSRMNCSGCHANGGGGMGPALIDRKWSYGSRPEQIFATIVEGRPNGMPSFRGKIPDAQVWQIAAFVRSMSGLASTGAAPSRNDDMQSWIPENSRAPESARQSGIPKSAEAPL